MPIKKVVALRIESGKAYDINGKKYKFSDGDYYLCPSRAFTRLVDAAYERARERDREDKKNLITIVMEEEYRKIFPQTLTIGNNLTEYYLSKYVNVIRGKIMMIRYLSSEMDLDEALEELKNNNSDIPKEKGK